MKELGLGSKKKREGRLLVFHSNEVNGNLGYLRMGFVRNAKTRAIPNFRRSVFFFVFIYIYKS